MIIVLVSYQKVTEVNLYNAFTEGNDMLQDSTIDNIMVQVDRRWGRNYGANRRTNHGTNSGKIMG